MTKEQLESGEKCIWSCLSLKNGLIVPRHGHKGEYLKVHPAFAGRANRANPSATNVPVFLNLFGANGGFLPDMCIFNLENYTWWHWDLPEFLEPVAAFSLAADAERGRIYVYGGFGIDPMKKTQRMSNQFFCLDLSRCPSFIDGKPLLEFEMLPTSESNCEAVMSARVGASLTLDQRNNRLLLFGGVGENCGLANDTVAFCIKTKTWTTLVKSTSDSEHSFPKPRESHSAHLWKEKYLVIVGGSGESGRLPDIWALDLDTLKWEELSNTCPGDSLGFSMHTSGLLNHSDQIVIFGGWHEIEPKEEPVKKDPVADSNNTNSNNSASKTNVLSSSPVLNNMKHQTVSANVVNPCPVHQPPKIDLEELKRRNMCSASVFCFGLEDRRWTRPVVDCDLLMEGGPVFSFPEDPSSLVRTLISDYFVPKGRSGHSACFVNGEMFIWSGRDEYNLGPSGKNPVLFKDLWILSFDLEKNAERIRERLKKIVGGRVPVDTAETEEIIPPKKLVVDMNCLGTRKRRKESLNPSANNTAVEGVDENAMEVEAYSAALEAASARGIYNPSLVYNACGELKSGDRVEILDRDGKWNYALIVQVKPGKVLVHYEGWSKRFDEYIVEGELKNRLKKLDPENELPWVRASIENKLSLEALDRLIKAYPNLAFTIGDKVDRPFYGPAFA